jgi:aldehyde dehydrogenase (NAD+)
MIDTLIENESLAKIQDVFELQQKNTLAVRNSTLKQRIAKLELLKAYIIANTPKIQDALKADFSKNPTETLITEIMVVFDDISYVKKHLADWMEPEQVPTPLKMLGSAAWIQKESKGNTLIIAPWNYPFNLAVRPLIQAIAAGCTVILKPSEITVHTSGLLAEMIAELFDENEIAVIEGGVEVSKELLSLPFDHIFFTGSPNVGKIVMTAAAQNLTSVTLELGGKSPWILDETANVEKVCAKLAWGKLVNNGQTCIAPDYALVHSSKKDQVIAATIKSINEMYNADNKGVINSESYCRIVDDRHFARVKSLIDDATSKGAKIVFGGEYDPKQRYISPTILTDVNDSMRIMQEEIFGPVLPILFFDEIDEAIEIINKKEKPLALYINSSKNSKINYILQNTSAGGTVINDTLLHFAHAELPIGGVNHSGIGKSGGKWGFNEFSNERAVVKQKFGTFEMVYAPYTTKVDKLVRFLSKYLS